MESVGKGIFCLAPKDMILTSTNFPLIVAINYLTALFLQHPYLSQYIG